MKFGFHFYNSFRENSLKKKSVLNLPDSASVIRAQQLFVNFGTFRIGAGPGETNLDEETELDNVCKKCAGQSALIREVWGTCPPRTLHPLHPWLK